MAIVPGLTKAALGNGYGTEAAERHALIPPVADRTADV